MGTPTLKPAVRCSTCATTTANPRSSAPTALCSTSRILSATGTSTSTVPNPRSSSPSTPTSASFRKHPPRRRPTIPSRHPPPSSNPTLCGSRKFEDLTTDLLPPAVAEAAQAVEADEEEDDDFFDYSY